MRNSEGRKANPMLDFMVISNRPAKKGVIEIYPRFIIGKSSDLMIRGGDFYAVWVEEKGLWSTDEHDLIQLIDRELDIYAEKNKERFDSGVRVLHLWDSESGMIDSWHKYCQKQMRDSFHILDEKLIFSDTQTVKTDYASKKLPYPLKNGDISAYDRLMSTLYSDSERQKIEWSIGSVVSGDSKKLQKFMVLYGSAGTGKSTVLNIIQMLFEGYYSVFDAKSLGSSNNAFALEAFRTNPLVAIQHDGDLSHIEDNTRLNSLVSHELMTVNEKFKSTYASRFNCFLFMGTNKPVRITDAKSGLIRRLIDVSPSGNKLSAKEYNAVMKQIGFELGAIAAHCRDVYLSDPRRYDNYIPVTMLGASNNFYNFIMESYPVFSNENGTTLKRAWEMYKSYCDEAKVSYPYSQMIFKEELKNYFKNYSERTILDDGTRVRSFYSGFRSDKFEDQVICESESTEGLFKLSFDHDISLFDRECADCPAQYASSGGTPTEKWENVNTKLSDIDTKRLHYVRVPINHIVIDFDIPDENGEKSFEKNLEAASKFPPTYAELSKSGAGIHLHYIYTGDVSRLSRVYADHIEIKVFNGNSALRRKLTLCNDIPIAEISSGLPLKGEKMVNRDVVKNEKGLRNLIKKNLNKEIHSSTKSSVDFIFKILEDAYASNMPYDITDMRNAVLAFAANSTNNADYCIKLVNKMHFKSEEQSEGLSDAEEVKIVFFDIEVFPNLFVCNFKVQGKDKPVVRMINPTPQDMENLMRFRLVGFNNRRYDNHIIYARMMGYTNEQLYNLSQKIISGSPNCFFGEAYNVSYTDIYDFASAGNKKSLKKLEIEMGIHHQELGLPWDKPVPEELWETVAEYCDNDVIATEAAFEYLSADFTARQILADLADMSVNDTTNTLTTRIIFGREKHPQSSFCYRDMSKPVKTLTSDVMNFLTKTCPEMMAETHEGYDGGEKSLLPYFPGYKYEFGKSTYRGEEVGEGGYVYAEPGIYRNVALLDIASMHPHSIISECLFGVEFTSAFCDIVYGRVDIKHEAWDKVNKILAGKLTPYVQKVIDGKMSSKDLANALKTAINSVYGLTAASFENPFRDPRNIDNIVAKRGALFMINLKHEVQQRGFTVAHIKTDSIKIPEATPEIIEFVAEYGKRYGYTFEHEATYEKMCLVNDAVYIAKYKDGKHAGEWTATGKQFAVPYVFKTLFSKEPVKFEDMCVTFSVSKGDLYLDMNEKLPEDEHNYIFVGRVGNFCPIASGKGGGVLYRMSDEKYYAAPGTKGYRWLEAEMVKSLNREDDIDISYFRKMTDDAVETIGKYGSFDVFVSDDKPPPIDIPCGSEDFTSCCGCPNFIYDQFHTECDRGYDILPF